jgi:hypothetical protein
MITGEFVNKIIVAISLPVLILCSYPAMAKDEAANKQQQEESASLWNYKRFLLDENGKWSIGTGAIVRNSPFKGEKIDAIPIPIIDYSSKNFFIVRLYPIIPNPIHIRKHYSITRICDYGLFRKTFCLWW